MFGPERYLNCESILRDSMSKAGSVTVLGRVLIMLARSLDAARNRLCPAAIKNHPNCICEVLFGSSAQCRAAGELPKSSL